MRDEAKMKGEEFNPVTVFDKLEIENNCCKTRLMCRIDQHTTRVPSDTRMQMPVPGPYIVADEQAQRDAIDRLLAVHEANRQNKRRRIVKAPTVDEAVRATTTTTNKPTTAKSNEPPAKRYKKGDAPPLPKFKD
jgi:hypothetical protein